MDGKRSYEGSEPYGGKRARTENYSEGGVSKVLHVRNVDPNNTHDELIAFVSQFGAVSSIVFLSKFNQALIELDSVQAASSVIMYAKTTPVYIKGKEVHFSYSKSQSINSQARTPENPSGINNVLLCTIVNPLFNITTDVMHAITSPFGTVLRIVIFTKNGAQALVEFDSPLAAAQAKAALEGKDIYAGSCTLKIEFSKSTKLNVHFNTDKTKDYTNPSLPAGPGQPPVGALGGLGVGLGGYPGMDPYGAPLYPPPAGMPGMPEPASRSVLIVYGLDEVFMNSDRIFNLFSLYGNVLKIKILTLKKSTMIQMGDNLAADYAIQNLNGLHLFGQQLQIQYSKHPYIADSRHETNPEGQTTSITKDFSSSPLNRFSRGTQNAYKHIYRPSATLYFSNAPKDFTEDAFIQLFTSQSVAPPLHIKFFSLPNDASKEASEKRVGLLEFADATAAAEGLVVVNNQRLGGFTLKLAFSQNSISQGGHHGGGGHQQPPMHMQMPLQPTPVMDYYGGGGGGGGLLA